MLVAESGVPGLVTDALGRRCSKVAAGVDWPDDGLSSVPDCLHSDAVGCGTRVFDSGLCCEEGLASSGF